MSMFLALNYPMRLHQQKQELVSGLLSVSFTRSLYPFEQKIPQEKEGIYEETGESQHLTRGRE